MFGENVVNEKILLVSNTFHSPRVTHETVKGKIFTKFCFVRETPKEVEMEAGVF